MQQCNKMDERDILKKLSSPDPGIRINAADTLNGIFRNISENKCETLLKQIAGDEHPGVRIRAIFIISANFGFISKDISLDILKKLSHDDYFGVRKEVLCTINKNFEALGDVALEITENLGRDKSSNVQVEVAKIIINHYDVLFLMKDALFLFAKDFHLRKQISEQVIRSCKFKKLPGDIKKLFEIKKPGEKKSAVRDTGESKFDIIEISDISVEEQKEPIHGTGTRYEPGLELLDQKVKNIPKIIKKYPGLLEFIYGNSAKEIYEISERLELLDIIDKTFKDIPGSLRNELLIKFSDDPKRQLKFRVTEVLTKNFNLISHSYGEKLLTKLLNDPDEHVKQHTVQCIYSNINPDDVPGNIMEILKRDAVKRLMGQSIHPAAGIYSEEVPESNNDESDEKSRVSKMIIKYQGLLEFIYGKGTEEIYELKTKQEILEMITRKFDHVPVNLREELLKKFSYDAEAAIRWKSADTAFKNFNKISDEIKKELLVNFAEDNERRVRSRAAEILLRNFLKIPGDFGEKIILKLAGDSESTIRTVVSEILIKNMDIIRNDVRNELLMKLLDDSNRYVKLHAAEGISLHENFNKIPGDIRDAVLKKLTNEENEQSRVFASKILTKNFRKISEKLRGELLVKLLDDASRVVRKQVAKDIYEYINLNEIPQEAREILAGEITVDKSSVVKSVTKKQQAKDMDKFRKEMHDGKLLTKNFMNIPMELREELLLNFLKTSKIYVKRDTVEGIYRYLNLNEISSSLLENLLENISDDKDTIVREYAGKIITKNMEFIPEKLWDELLIKLLNDNNHYVRQSTLEGIFKYFGFRKFPETLQEILFMKLAVDGDLKVRELVLKMLFKNFRGIKRSIREESLKKFVSDNSVQIREQTAGVVAKYFIEISKDLREELTVKLLNDNTHWVREKAQEIKIR